MGLTLTSLKNIAADGGSLVLNYDVMGKTDIKEICKKVSDSNVTITLIGLKTATETDIRDLVKNCKGKVVLDFYR